MRVFVAVVPRALRSRSASGLGGSWRVWRSSQSPFNLAIVDSRSFNSIEHRVVSNASIKGGIRRDSRHRNVGVYFRGEGAAVRAAREQGIDFILHVVGFDVAGEDVSQLECAA